VQCHKSVIVPQPIPHPRPCSPKTPSSTPISLQSCNRRRFALLPAGTDLKDACMRANMTGTPLRMSPAALPSDLQPTAKSLFLVENGFKTRPFFCLSRNLIFEGRCLPNSPPLAIRPTSVGIKRFDAAFSDMPSVKKDRDPILCLLNGVHRFTGFAGQSREVNSPFGASRQAVTRAWQKQLCAGFAASSFSSPNCVA